MKSKEKALLFARVACDKKALDLVILEIKDLSSFADYFIICSGESTRQVQAIAEHLEINLKEQGIRPLGTEGAQGGRWVLLDYGDVIIHVFHETEREYYDLESLWGDCPRIAFDEKQPPPAKKGKK